MGHDCANKDFIDCGCDKRKSRKRKKKGKKK